MAVNRWGPLLGMAGLLALGACGSEEKDSCFVGETLVSTPKGPVRIDALAVGDEVWSWNPDEGLVARAVKAVHRERVRTVVEVRVGSAKVHGVTPSHPFYDAAAGAYVALRDLEAKARLRVFADDVHEDVAVTSLSIEEAPEPRFEVFNLTVDGPEHNYIADAILVHNKSPPIEDPVCGDGFQEGAEGCDDGNTMDGDGCSATCEVETTTTSSTGGGGGAGGAGGGGGTGGQGGAMTGGGGAGGG